MASVGICGSEVHDDEHGQDRTVCGAPAAITQAAIGAFSLDELVTGHHGLAEVDAALRSTRMPGTIRSIVRPGE